MRGRISRHLGRIMPDSFRARIRWAFSAHYLLILGVAVPSLAPARDPAGTALALLALAWLLASWWLGYRRGRQLVVMDVGDAVAFVLIGLGLSDRSQLAASLAAGLLLWSCFGRHRDAAIRTALYVAALVVALSVPGLAGQPGRPATALSIIPGLLIITVVIRLLAVTVEANGRSAAYERILSAAAVDLLRSRGSAEALASTLSAVRALCSRITDAVVLVVDDERRAEATPRPRLRLPEELRTGRHAARPVVVRAGELPGLDGLGAAEWWTLIGVSPGEAVEHAIVVGSGRPLPKDTLMALSTLAGQANLALAARHAHEQLLFRAHHDELTALPNRAAFADILDTHLARGAPESLAVLFVDLDDFKHVNDRYGHAAGDILLTVVAERIRGCLRDHDVAARLGSDEFVVLLTRLRTPDQAEQIASRIAGRLALPVSLPTAEVATGASIGVVMGTDGATPGELLRLADIAMYSAKTRGKSRVEVFDAAAHSEVERLRSIADQLPDALSRGELSLHYQPIVDLRTEECVGLEALLRWRHPELGIVSPAEFIPVAERTGQIVPIGRWAVRQASAAAAKWRRLTGDPELRLFVNVSAVQLRDPGLAADVRAALTQAGLPAANLTLELTESQLIESDVREPLDRLTAIGVRLAIDDFGTGYSSLSYLGSLPVSVLKIDRSFTKQAPKAANGSELTRVVVRIGDALSLSTIAEGVETLEELAALRAAGARYAQGYYFTRPLPEDDAMPWLAARPALSRTA